MEGMGQDKKDLQVLGELELLHSAVVDTSDRMEILGTRLAKVMINPPQEDVEGKQPEKQLCDVAKQIQDERCVVRKVFHNMVYILDNLQL